MPAVLALLLCAAPAQDPTPAQRIHERAWKVALAGGVMTVAGLGFLVGGRALDASMPSDPGLQNTARAFTVGGVMLAISGALVAALSLPMWAWRDEAETVAVTLGPLGGAVRW
ncbi:MAG: hypothetical protein INH37_16085 [Myxococcaceae bacterium]|jgi:hypothetical protein|nr:hypothetical protein [Myxococcaceae bacterium]